LSDHLQHSHHGLSVAKPEIKAIRVPFGEDAILVTLHCKGDEASRGDGIQAIGIAELIGLRDGFQVGNTTHGTEGGYGFILRTSVDGIHEIGLPHLDLPLAADEAAVAGASALQNGFRHGLAADGLGGIEGSFPEIEGW
jgi:hypothetical protein